MGESPQNERNPQREDQREEQLECYEYIRSHRTNRLLVWYFYNYNGRVRPVVQKRSSKGARGKDCYRKEDIITAVVAIKKSISDDSFERSKVYILQKKIPRSVIETIYNERELKYDIMLEKISRALKTQGVEITEE